MSSKERIPIASAIRMRNILLIVLFESGQLLSPTDSFVKSS